MTLYPKDPFRFDFIIDSGNTDFTPEEIQHEAEQLVRYFLAALTIPKDDLWVNLSPHESDRIIPDELGKTELGRDMLAQDYILKQLTASMLYPENELGGEFWNRVYEKAKDQFGTSQIPVNTFNKVWIVPESATVYEKDNTVYVVESRLKVMLDEDYLTRQNDKIDLETAAGPRNPGYRTPGNESRFDASASISSQIVREIIIPEIEREVNEGKNFAPLRQIYHSLILSKWYKETIDESLLSKIYIDQKKIAGVELDDENIKNQIYEQYMRAYQKGVFNFIKEDYDQLSRGVVPKKYFSGGEEFDEILIKKTAEKNKLASSPVGDNYQLSMRFSPQKNGVDLVLEGFSDKELLERLHLDVLDDGSGRIRYGEGFEPVQLGDLRLFIVSHGQTDFNEIKGAQDARADGRPEFELNEKGKRQAVWGAQNLLRWVEKDITDGNLILYESPSKRAHQTAVPFLDLVKEKIGKNLDLTVHPGIREIDLGSWSGLTPDQLKDRDEQAFLQLKDFQKRNVLVQPKGGQSFLQYLDAVKQGLEDIVANNQGKTVVLYTHGIYIRALKVLLQTWDIPTEDFIDYGDIAPDLEERGAPVFINDLLQTNSNRGEASGRDGQTTAQWNNFIMEGNEAQRLGFKIVDPQKGRMTYADDFEPFDLSDMDLVIVPHGLTDGDEMGILQSSKNDENRIYWLNQKGERQAEEGAAFIWEKYKEQILIGNSVFYSSGLKRTRQTAEKLLQIIRKYAPEFEMDLIDASDIRRSFGAWEGVHKNERHEKLSAEEQKRAAAFLEKNVFAKSENGQSFIEYLRQVKDMLEDWKVKHRGKTVFVYGHGIFIKAVKVLLRTSDVTSYPYLNWDSTSKEAYQSGFPLRLKDWEVYDKAHSHVVSRRWMNPSEDRLT
jgi:broad specificity phosphatase PhoE